MPLRSLKCAKTSGFGHTSSEEVLCRWYVVWCGTITLHCTLTLHRPGDLCQSWGSPKTRERRPRAARMGLRVEDVNIAELSGTSLRGQPFALALHRADRFARQLHAPLHIEIAHSWARRQSINHSNLKDTKIGETSRDSKTKDDTSELTSGKLVQPAQSRVVKFGHSNVRSTSLPQYVKLIVSSRGQTIESRCNCVMGELRSELGCVGPWLGSKIFPASNCRDEALSNAQTQPLGNVMIGNL